MAQPLIDSSFVPVFDTGAQSNDKKKVCSMNTTIELFIILPFF